MQYLIVDSVYFLPMFSQIFRHDGDILFTDPTSGIGCVRATNLDSHRELWQEGILQEPASPLQG
jgi:hypothetical protein